MIGHTKYSYMQHISCKELDFKYVGVLIHFKANYKLRATKI